MLDGSSENGNAEQYSEKKPGSEPPPLGVDRGRFILAHGWKSARQFLKPLIRTATKLVPLHVLIWESRDMWLFLIR